MYNVSKLSELPDDVQIELFESNRRFYNDIEHFQDCLKNVYNYLSEFIAEIGDEEVELKEGYNILVTYKFKSESYMFIAYSNSTFYEYVTCTQKYCPDVKVIPLNEHVIDKKFIKISETRYNELLEIEKEFELITR